MPDKQRYKTHPDPEKPGYDRYNGEWEIVHEMGEWVTLEWVAGDHVPYYFAKKLGARIIGRRKGLKIGSLSPI